jgi:hypothetical protein
MSTYRLISSDSHIIEPPDLWEQRIDRSFRDRAPRLVHAADADQWYADGVKFGNIGINQQAGLRFETPEHLTVGGRMATVPLGGSIHMPTSKIWTPMVWRVEFSIPRKG